MKHKNAAFSNLQLIISFGAGVAGGIIGGFLVSSRIHNARRMPNAAAWEQFVAQERGHVQSCCFVNQVESRYWQLFYQRPYITDEALRKHMNQFILPGLALYQVLIEEGMDMPDALATVEQAFDESMRTSRIPLALLGQIPLFYPILRALTPKVMESSFPSAGWEVEWIDDSQDSVAFNMHSCFYLNTLTEYGAPELTLVFCKMDDNLYDGTSPYVRWERTGTLARGDDVCDFRWSRVK